jgi:hypothetical protein
MMMIDKPTRDAAAGRGSFPTSRAEESVILASSHCCPASAGRYPIYRSFLSPRISEETED